MSRKSREMKKNIAALAIVAVFALLVFSINSIGKFIAEKVISPVVKLGTSDDGSVSTQKVSGSAWEVYGVALPASSQSEAATLADSVKSNNGGGYIFSSDDGVFVIFACLGDKSKAQSMASGMNGASMLTFRLDALSLKVTGSETKISSVKNAFALLQKAVQNTVKLTDGVQDGEKTYLQCCTGLQALRKELESCYNDIEALNSDNPVVKALKDMYSCALTLWDEMPKSSDSTFLKKMRYTSSAFVCEYMNFCSDLGG